jgi:hypothetical protein
MMERVAVGVNEISLREKRRRRFRAAFFNPSGICNVALGMKQ